MYFVLFWNNKSTRKAHVRWERKPRNLCTNTTLQVGQHLPPNDGIAWKGSWSWACAFVCNGERCGHAPPWSDPRSGGLLTPAQHVALRREALLRAPSARFSSSRATSPFRPGVMGADDHQVAVLPARTLPPPRGRHRARRLLAGGWGAGRVQGCPGNRRHRVLPRLTGRPRKKRSASGA